MSRRANLFRLVLSSVKTITIGLTIVIIGSCLYSPPLPMTSTKHIETTKCVATKAEINKLIESNLKKLKIIKLENKIEEYIVQDNKKGLKKETCKVIAKNIVAHSKFPIITTSIIFYESSYNKLAVNKKSGTVGLGQISPVHEEELKQAGIITSFKDLKKIKQNVQAIDFVLHQKLKIAGGDMNEALKLYSGNTTNYNKKIWNKVKEIKEYIKTT